MDYPEPEFACGTDGCYLEYSGIRASNINDVLFVPKNATIIAKFRVLNRGADGKVMVAVVDSESGAVLGSKETELNSNDYWEDSIMIPLSEFADEILKAPRRNISYISYYYDPDSGTFKEYEEIDIGTVEISPIGAEIKETEAIIESTGQIDLSEYLVKIPNSAPCSEVTVTSDKIIFKFQENCVDGYFDLSKLSGAKITFTAGTNDLNGQLECENNIWNPSDVKFIQVYPEKTVTLPQDIRPLLVLPTASVGREVWVSRYANVSGKPAPPPKKRAPKQTPPPEQRPSPTPTPAPTPPPEPTPEPSPEQPPHYQPPPEQPPRYTPTRPPVPRRPAPEYCTVFIKPIRLPAIRAVEVVAEVDGHKYSKVMRGNEQLSFRAKIGSNVTLIVKEALSLAREYRGVAKPNKNSTIRYKWNASFSADNLEVV